MRLALLRVIKTSCHIQRATNAEFPRNARHASTYLAVFARAAHTANFQKNQKLTRKTSDRVVTSEALFTSLKRAVMSSVRTKDQLPSEIGLKPFICQCTQSIQCADRSLISEQQDALLANTYVHEGTEHPIHDKASDQQKHSSGQ